MDAHDTHCCIDHGCKYGEDDCPVANGVRKQCYLCEQCGLETEDYYSNGYDERTYEEQHDYIAALWEHKQNPKVLTLEQKSVARLIEFHGWSRLHNILTDIQNLPLSVIEIIKIMEGLKHLTKVL